MKKILMIVWMVFFVCSFSFVNLSSAQEEIKDCSAFESDACPTETCAVVTNCRGIDVCADKPFDPPSCGSLAYEGQDVLCCDGMVRRCGVAFLDDTCDMFGDHSEYNLPICIPCGDGFCTNFENVCNCPEDCWPDDDRIYTGQLFDGEKLQSPQPLQSGELN